MLGRRNLPKLVCEKVEFLNSDFCTMIGNTYKIFKNIFKDFLNKGKREVNMVCFDIESVERLKYAFFIDSTSVFYHLQQCFIPPKNVKYTDPK